MLVAGTRSRCGLAQEGKGFTSILLLTGAPCECEAFELTSEEKYKVYLSVFCQTLLALRRLDYFYSTLLFSNSFGYIFYFLCLK